MASELEELADQAKQAYLLERRFFLIRTRGHDRDVRNLGGTGHWDGGTDSRGTKHPNYWLKIAQFALQNSVSPVTLIKAAFEGKAGGHPWMPNQLTQQQFVQSARNWASRQIEELRFKCEGVKREALQDFLFKQSNRSDDAAFDTWGEVLTSPTLNSGPLFRYCIALDVGHAELARRIQHSALLEYVQSPNEYDKVLGNFLPEDFRQKGHSLIKRMLLGS